VAVVFGVDVSHFQHGLSLAAVRAQGYEFVIAKATQGRVSRMPTSTRSARRRPAQLNAKTILMLQSAERRLGQRLVITQGSFNTTVGPSKGTHDRGGVFDVSVRGPGATINKKLRARRREGFAAWHRRPEQFKAADHVPEHIHAVSLFDTNLSTAAGNQKRDFLAKPPLNGLANKVMTTGRRCPDRTVRQWSSRPCGGGRSFSTRPTIRSAICRTCSA
jgi:hypothetical protein